MTGNKPLIYVAHPYGGNETNKSKVDKIMSTLVTLDPAHVYVSPIHNFGMVYFDKEYAKGLEICLNLLEQCKVIILCGDWQHSKGCIGEWAYSTARGKEIYTLSEWMSKQKIGIEVAI